MAPAPLPAPGLHLVATPIGNLGDISLRALAVLRGADRIYCEDTRITARLLARYGIKTRLNPITTTMPRRHGRRSSRIGARRAGGAGQRAGTPLVSDPGYKLVQAAIAEGLPVTAAPGASAVLTALLLSGLPPDRFLFAGFLPRHQAARRQALTGWALSYATLVFYESPPRLAAALADMAEILGPRSATVARELTKLHEEVRRGALAELASHYRNAGPPRGETVVVIGPPEPRSAPDADEIDAGACGRRWRNSGARRRGQACRRNRCAAQRALPTRVGDPRGQPVRRVHRHGAARPPNTVRRRRAERRGRLGDGCAYGICGCAAGISSRAAGAARPARST